MANNRTERPNRDRDKYGEYPDLFIRDMVGWAKELCPSDYMHFLQAFGYSKILTAFNHGEFCVLSGMKEGATMEKNLERQFFLVEEARCMGLGCIPHTGYWDDLPHRCLFVPFMPREQARILCREHKLPNYIHGSLGVWCSYSSKADRVISRDTTLKYIDFDEPFLMYYKLNRKKFLMALEGQGILKKKKLSARQKERLQIIARQIEDLDRIEMEIIRKQL